ncbi:aa3-type cytochrome c oxidase subunit IV [Camelimonas sp. ID_303_24]
MANHSNAVTTGGHPDMDYPAHENTYEGFLKGSKWGVGAIILILVLMAWFLL